LRFFINRLGFLGVSLLSCSNLASSSDGSVDLVLVQVLVPFKLDCSLEIDVDYLNSDFSHGGNAPYAKFLV
jgi:hypothetical protein